NLTYMLPETIITAAGAYFLGSVLDFRSSLPGRLKDKKTGGTAPLTALAVGLVTAAVVYDVAAIFPYTQDANTGEFTLSRLGEVAWWPVVILTALAVLASVILALIVRRKKAPKE
ncbi:MAG: hypothetical protein J6R77_05575, partial [Clostridia bacterium]|nr:hypothetical protein [Clostridia bacterium]